MAQFNPIRVTSPNVLGAIQQGQQIRGQFQDRQIQQQQQEQKQTQLVAQQEKSQFEAGLAKKIAGGGGTEEDLTTLLASNPKLAENLLNSAGLNDQRKRDDAANFAFDLMNTPFEQREAKIQSRAKLVKDRGGDPSNTLGLSGDDEEAQNISLKNLQTAALSAKDRLATQAPAKLSSLQQKVQAEGLDPLTTKGQARAREITQGSRTDPSLKPSDQQLINKASEGQLQSSTFANRVGAANEVLAELEATEGFDPTSLQTAFFEAIPGGNLALNANEQRFAQAKRDFITAVLRKESGAAIGKDEFINEDKKFFPQVGDKPHLSLFGLQLTIQS